MQPHEKRVVKERKKLQKKVVKLIEFLESDKSYEIIQPSERYVMEAQLGAMIDYSNALKVRIEKVKG